MTTKSPMQAVLYVRVASSKQHSDWWSQRQLAGCRRWANKHSLTVAREFTDLGVSGLDAKRPALAQLFKYLKSHPVDYVVCEELTALASDNLLSTALMLDVQGSGGAKVAIADLDAVFDIHVGLPGKERSA